MSQRTIKFALFSYTDPSGRTVDAYRGDTVDLSPEDIKRGEEYGAFTDRVGQEPPSPGTIAEATDPSLATQQELRAWVRDANEAEVVARAKDNPSEAQALLDAERDVRGSGNARTKVEQGLAAVLADSRVAGGGDTADSARTRAVAASALERAEAAEEAAASAGERAEAAERKLVEAQQGIAKQVSAEVTRQLKAKPSRAPHSGAGGGGKPEPELKPGTGGGGGG